MSIRSVEYLVHLSRGNVREFAAKNQILMEAVHGLEAQLSLVAMMFASMRREEFDLPVEIMGSIEKRIQERCHELSCAMRLARGDGCRIAEI